MITVLTSQGDALQLNQIKIKNKTTISLVLKSFYFMDYFHELPQQILCFLEVEVF